MQSHAYYPRCAGGGISRNHDGLAKAGLGRQERPGAGPLVGDKPRRFGTLFRLLLGGITRPTPLGFGPRIGVLGMRSPESPWT